MWGGTHNSNLQKVQTALNAAAHVVLNVGHKTRVWTIMEHCKWFYAQELYMMHSLVFLWKVLHHKRPRNLCGKFELTEDDLVWILVACIQIANISYRWRAGTMWNNLPLEIRQIDPLPRFKSRLRSWIIEKRLPESSLTEIHSDLSQPGCLSNCLSLCQNWSLLCPLQTRNISSL